MNIQAVIFDLGGTLIEYAGSYDRWPDLETPGFTAAYDYLGQKGMALPDFDHFRDTGFALLPQRWQRAAAGEQNLRLVDLLAAVLEQCHLPSVESAWLTEAGALYEAAICGQAYPAEGVHHVLAEVKAQGYKMGLLSNTMFTGQAHQADLKRFDLEEYFDTMLFSADVGKWKPTSAPFLHVAEALGVAPETAVYIGDDPASDIIGGQRAGMSTIHVQSSNRFPLGDAEPDARVQHLTDILPILNTWRHNTQSSPDK